MTMHAAVVRSFDHPPRYEIYDTPEPAGPDEASSTSWPSDCTPGSAPAPRDGTTPAPARCP